MKMKKIIRLDRLVPAEMDAGRELRRISIGLVLAGLYSLGFVVEFLNARAELFVSSGKMKILDQSAVMRPFFEILDGWLLGFAILALCMVFLAARYYAKHYSGGSRSVYLMRRLPDRLELHIRCLSIPLLSALLCAVCAFALLWIYYIIYIIFTPEPCLASGQWAMVWRC